MRCSIAGIAGALVGFPFGFCLGSVLAIVTRRALGHWTQIAVAGERWQLGVQVVAPLVGSVLGAWLVARLETRPARVPEWRLNVQRVALLLLTLPMLAIHVEAISWWV